jgi:hypothetical protein
MKCIKKCKMPWGSTSVAKAKGVEAPCLRELFMQRPLPSPPPASCNGRLQRPLPVAAFCNGRFLQRPPTSPPPVFCNTVTAAYDGRPLSATTAVIAAALFL